MLSLHARDGQIRPMPADLAAAPLAADIVWLDLLNPTAAEMAFVERTAGHHVPSREDLSEIESSSRLRTEDGVLCMSVPLVYRAAGDEVQATPLGFILGPERLVTVRFEPLPSFTSLGAAARSSSSEAFAAIMEAIIDRIADGLEHLAGELDALSHRLFRSAPAGGAAARQPKRASADLRSTLRRVGASGDLVSKIRDSLLGLSRIVPYVEGMGAAWLPDPVKARLETMRHDIASLSDYDTHLDSKVQLLLDATLGLINVDQNDIIKVLTIVSVVGVPPTLVASMYGMNFKNIPEYDWSFGYEWGLALIAITAIAPLLWFKWRGWF